MDFLAELLLCYIDKRLAQSIEEISSEKDSDHKIIRYKDDYRIFTHNPEVSEQIFRDLTCILNSFGMKINLSKTESSNDIVHSSIKPDKLGRMIKQHFHRNIYGNVYRRFYFYSYRELYTISAFSKSFPNSAQTNTLLYNFYKWLIGLSKDVEDLKDVEVLISISVDIAYNNPYTYQMVAAIISKLITFLEDTERKEIINKIIKKFEKLPNTGIMEIWLQRVTIKYSKKYEYQEDLCNRASGENTLIWNSSWLDESTKKIIESINFVDSDIVNDLPDYIKLNEVELFELINSYTY